MLKSHNVKNGIMHFKNPWVSDNSHAAQTHGWSTG